MLMPGSNSPDTLVGGDGSDQINGGPNRDSLFGGGGGDTLNGGIQRDKLRGGDGADFLNGAQGADKLIGGDGADVLLGGTGNDQLFLGTVRGDDARDGNADVIVVNTVHGKDLVWGFEAGIDGIELLGDGSIDHVVTARGSDTLVQYGSTIVEIQGLVVADPDNPVELNISYVEDLGLLL